MINATWFPVLLSLFIPDGWGFIPSQFSFKFFFLRGGGEAWWVAKALILLWHSKSQSVGLDSILLNSQRVPLFFSVFPSTTDSWYSAYIPQDASRWDMEWICLPAGTTIPRLVKHLFLFCRKGQLPYILSQRHKIKFFFYSDYVFSIILIFTYGGGYSDASFVRYYCHAHSKVWKDERKWFILVSLNFQTCLLAPPLKISRPHRETRYWGRL